MKVTINIPNYNGKHFMEPCLQSLANQTCSEFQILVVDNASSDGSIEYMRENYPDIELISLNQNYGFSAAVNVGIRHSTTPYVLLLNNDTTVAPEFVDEMRFWHKLRERLRPYLWETAQACVAGNMPMMRPLSFLWPEDEAALACEDEYMLGDALLVAPLLEENANTRQVYLPDGEWIGFFDRKPYQGKQMICTDCDGKIPVFIRSGYEKQF